MTGGKTSLRKNYRAVIEAARDEAAKIGATVDYNLAGGKHPQIILHLAGGDRIIPFAGTPRTAEHGPTWIRQRIRQKARMIAHPPGCEDFER